MDTNASLRELGLSYQEAQIYLELLRLGPSHASTIAKSSGIKRTTIYALLKALAEKGFTSMYVKRGRQIFEAEKPQAISHYYETKLKNFTDVIPHLETLDKKTTQVLGLRFIETVPELKRFYFKVLKEYKNKSYSILGNANAWQGIEPDFFIQFRKDRAAANIRTKILLSADSAKSSPKDESLLREVRLLPKNYSFKSTLDIFEDKVLIVSPELTSLAVVIAIPPMVDVFHSVFEMLWEIAVTKKV